MSRWTLGLSSRFTFHLPTSRGSETPQLGGPLCSNWSRDIQISCCHLMFHWHLISLFACNDIIQYLNACFIWKYYKKGFVFGTVPFLCFAYCKNCEVMISATNALTEFFITTHIWILVYWAWMFSPSTSESRKPVRLSWHPVKTVSLTFKRAIRKVMFFKWIACMHYRWNKIIRKCITEAGLIQ